MWATQAKNRGSVRLQSGIITCFAQQQKLKTIKEGASQFAKIDNGKLVLCKLYL